MNTTTPTNVRPRGETRPARRRFDGLKSIARRLWDALPSVHPFVGPEGLEARPGERRLMMNGRVVTIRVARRSDPRV